MENAQNRAMPATVPAKPPEPKLPVPVNPTTGKPIRIISVNCEFCGINASNCEHAKAFRDNNILQRSAAMKEDQKVYQNFPGLPRVIAKICEFCGVDARICAHGEERKKLAKTANLPSRNRVYNDRGVKVYIKEPENTEVEEKKLTKDEYSALKVSQNAANAKASAPMPSDKDVEKPLQKMSLDKGIGVEDNDDVDL